MKLSKTIEGRRTHQPLASEMLRQPEEPDFRFDPKVHLTAEDWRLAADEMVKYWAGNNQVAMFSLVFFETLIDGLKSRQVLDQAGNGGVCDWFKELGSVEAEQSLAAIDWAEELRGSEKTRAKIYARNLFPDQLLFSVTAEELNQLILSTYGGGSSVALRALQIEYFKKQSPGVTTDELLPQFVLTNDYLQEIIQGIQSSLNESDLVSWVGIVFKISMLRIASSDSFEQLNLDQVFWKKAVSMLEVIHPPAFGPITIFKYASYLELLATKTLSLDERGNMVLDHKRSQSLSKPSPLPLRNTT